MERLGNLPVRSQTAPTKTTTPTAAPAKTESLAVSNSVPNIIRTDEEGRVGERDNSKHLQCS